jgi:hypothetical protein
MFSFSKPKKHTLMKKIFLPLLMLFACVAMLQPVHAIADASSVILPSGSRAAVKPEDPANSMLVQQFLTLTPKKYYELTGKKMKLSQKISLRLAQWKVKKMIRKGKSVDLMALSKKGIDSSDFNIAGFLLGFFLSLIGVLIAYLVGGDDLIKWAWLGAGLSALIWLLAVLL